MHLLCIVQRSAPVNHLESGLMKLLNVVSVEKEVFISNIEHYSPRRLLRLIKIRVAYIYRHNYYYNEQN